MNLLGFSSSIDSTTQGGECSEVVSLTVRKNLGLVGSACPHVNSLDAEFIPTVDRKIPLILGVANISNIIWSVVRLVMVNMVNLPIWGLTRMENPSDVMGVVILPIEYRNPVAIWHNVRINEAPSRESSPPAEGDVRRYPSSLRVEGKAALNFSNVGSRLALRHRNFLSVCLEARQALISLLGFVTLTLNYGPVK